VILNPFQLVVFDVDGTLYDQRPLRRKLVFELLRNAFTSDGLTTVRILRSYRKWREEMADNEIVGFENILTERLTARYRISAEQINRIISDWIEVKPLKFLANCRRPGVDELFAHLRRSGKKIGILSDYPAYDKLAWLGLEADYIVSARDQEVNVQKPHPRGLNRLIMLAGVTSEATVMVGDRADRDGEMGRRAGVRTLLLSDKPLPGWTCFRTYSELFDVGVNSREV
jgi:putative hydrolase of the HAD superfamily